MTNEQTKRQALERLFETILSRRGADPDTSYTASLFDKGTEAITEKVREEALETIEAALTEAPERITSESADLLYHLLVLWAEKGIEPADVWAELERREGTSGTEEKKSREKD